MSEYQGGSCEPCKKKKCKCDRQLPSCGQCETSHVECRYSESNKRGIPTGYLASLEQRLSETEAALYNALSELRNSKEQGALSNYDGDFIFVAPRHLARDMNPNKIARMEEWKDYPLQDVQSLERWLEFFGSSQAAGQNANQSHIGAAPLQIQKRTNQEMQQPSAFEEQYQDYQISETSLAEDLIRLSQGQPSTSIPFDTTYPPSAIPGPSSTHLQSQNQFHNINHPSTTNCGSPGPQALGHMVPVDAEHDGQSTHTRLLSATENETLRDSTELHRSKQLSAEHKHVYY
ncbi:hypothetical protein B0O99DRAFT_645574 [Bisporella sp. PMI_857]|nr:hypothetical protein B0O99DRAFT_645574 [Bisporella sp. PMI_857]